MPTQADLEARIKDEIGREIASTELRGISTKIIELVNYFSRYGADQGLGIAGIPKFLDRQAKKNREQTLKALEKIQYNKQDVLQSYASECINQCVQDGIRLLAWESEEETEIARAARTLHVALQNPTDERIKKLKQVLNTTIKEKSRETLLRDKLTFFKRTMGALSLATGISLFIAGQDAWAGLSVGIGSYFLLTNPAKYQVRTWQAYRALLKSPPEVWRTGLLRDKECLARLVQSYMQD